MARRRDLFSFGRVTSEDAYKKFLASGDLLTKGEGVSEFSNIDRSFRASSEDSAKRTTLAKVRRDSGLSVRSSTDRLVKVDQDQVDLLTGLFEKRLNEISARRSRPGLSQVK